MKFMTYNILDGGGDRFNLLAEIIIDEQPDFLTINEANGFDGNNQQKLKEFSKLINMPYFHLALSGEYDYHVAVLSKLPLQSVSEIHPLKRAGILSVVSTNVGDIAIVSTHLTPTSEATRIPEIELILSKLSDYKNKIIMGDMNSLSSDDGYSNEIINGFNDMQIRKFTLDGKLQYRVIDKIKQSGFIDTGLCFDKQDINTAPTASNVDISHSKMRLDYILISDSLKSHILNYEVIKSNKTEQASDHYPVVLNADF